MGQGPESRADVEESPSRVPEYGVLHIANMQFLLGKSRLRQKPHKLRHQPNIMPTVCFRESIFGYYNLKIRLYYSAARLTTYFGITYSDRVTPDKFEGIQVRFCLVFHCIASCLLGGHLKNLASWVPPHMHSFSLF
jgi:hypothetical protein